MGAVLASGHFKQWSLNDEIQETNITIASLVTIVGLNIVDKKKVNWTAPSSHKINLVAIKNKFWKNFITSPRKQG